MRTGKTQFREILDQLMDGIAVVADGAIVYVNPAVTEMFGCDEGDLLGTNGGIPFTQAPTTGCGGVSSSGHGYP